MISLIQVQIKRQKKYHCSLSGKNYSLILPVVNQGWERHEAHSIGDDGGRSGSGPPVPFTHRGLKMKTDDLSQEVFAHFPLPRPWPKSRHLAWRASTKHRRAMPRTPCSSSQSPPRAGVSAPPLTGAQGLVPGPGKAARVHPSLMTDEASVRGHTEGNEYIVAQSKSWGGRANFSEDSKGQQVKHSALGPQHLSHFLEGSLERPGFG